MEKKIITESEMKELLESNENLDNHCVDLETARKIIMDAILPLCKWTIKLQAYLFFGINGKNINEAINDMYRIENGLRNIIKESIKKILNII